MGQHLGGVLGVVDASIRVVVAEAVVCPPGLVVQVLAGKQQWRGLVAGPGASAVETMAGCTYDVPGGGVDEFLWAAGQIGDKRTRHRPVPGRPYQCR